MSKKLKIAGIKLRRYGEPNKWHFTYKTGKKNRYSFVLTEEDGEVSVFRYYEHFEYNEFHEDYRWVTMHENPTYLGRASDVYIAVLKGIESLIVAARKHALEDRDDRDYEDDDYFFEQSCKPDSNYKEDGDI